MARGRVFGPAAHEEIRDFAEQPVSEVRSSPGGVGQAIGPTWWMWHPRKDMRTRCWQPRFSISGEFTIRQAKDQMTRAGLPMRLDLFDELLLNVNKRLLVESKKWLHRLQGVALLLTMGAPYWFMPRRGFSTSLTI